MRFLRATKRAIFRSVELEVEFGVFARIKVSDTHVQNSGNTLPRVNLVRFILRKMEETCMSCALALDVVDGGDGCISLDTWHGDAYKEALVHTCGFAHVRWRSFFGVVTRAGRHVSMCS